jgi:hypothetical protein
MKVGRMGRVLLSLIVVLILFSVRLSAQTTSATVSGQITDPTGRVVPGTTVMLTNINTGVVSTATTNNEGVYTLPGLQPGVYRANVTKDGFKGIVKPDIELHVQDQISINFVLQVGSVSETVTVEGGAPLLNTTDGSVGTVVDRNFVENMPLNGRSFQDLILLSPGVLTSSPQNSNNGGEFEVNGQRNDANYYTVDGVSANVGISPYNAPSSPGLSGSLPSSTALGTTQSLISVDALEEFRVETSSYSAEYGRNPGGQFSFATRSGTNEWHGSGFDYIRNNFFDANDWFNDYNHVPQSALRQNDFGGTVGGPVTVPGLYDGKDRTFFFFSYEGLRLLQPVNAQPSFYPDLCLRGVNPGTNCTGTDTPAPAALQPVLNAFPIPNCTNSSTCINPGGGFAEFLGSFSDPSSIDSYSVRLDHAINERMKVFFRFGDTQSSTNGKGYLYVKTAFSTQSYTLGLTTMFSNRLSNDVRLNYTGNQATDAVGTESFGGSVPVDLFALQGLSGTARPFVSVDLFSPDFAGVSQYSSTTQQEQWNLTDTASLSIGRNQLKFGVDYRHLRPQIIPYSPQVIYFYFSQSAILSNSAEGSGTSFVDVKPYYENFSAFLQDELRLSPRLSLSMGVRWEVNPAPGSENGNSPYTVRGSSLATLVLAPKGTPLWDTTWFNFAPRLGVAYVLRNQPHWETVVRGGAGVFFDTGQQNGSAGYAGLGQSARTGNLFGAFPFAPAQVDPTIPAQPTAPYAATQVFPQHLQLPYTLQWNFAVQQALGGTQTLTLSYVASHASRLLEENEVHVAPVNPNFTYLEFFQNGLTSDYDALQAQFQRRLSRGIQVLASYTWSHAIDYGSNNQTLPYIRGNADFDVRHSFASAISYDLPSEYENAFARAILGHWSVDDRFSARTGFPVTLAGNFFIDPATGSAYQGQLDIVPNEPFYLYGANCASTLQALGDLGTGQGCPGGRAINPNAFSLPADPTDPGNAPRNFTRGFGAWQMDLAVRREFPIYEHLKLQFRAEAFNVFNHPNFGYIDNGFGDTQFGQAVQTLGQSISAGGAGGLSALYQQGGNRSMQFALKLLF